MHVIWLNFIRQRAKVGLLNKWLLNTDGSCDCFVWTIFREKQGLALHSGGLGGTL